MEIELETFHNNLKYLDSLNKSTFIKMLEFVDVNLLQAMVAEDNEESKRILHKAIIVKKRLNIEVLIDYLKHTDKKYDLGIYLKKLKMGISSLVVILLHHTDLKAVDMMIYLEHEYLQQYPQEFQQIFQNYFDQIKNDTTRLDRFIAKLKDNPYLIIDLNLDFANLNPAYSNDISDLTVAAQSLLDQIDSLAAMLNMGSGFIKECLREAGDPEVATLRILEGHLSERLEKMDRMLKLDANLKIFYNIIEEKTPESEQIDTLPPVSSLLDTRKNIFDGDKYDIFTHGNIANELIMKKETALTPLSEAEKERILAEQLAEDDEFDDTYADNILIQQEESVYDEKEKVLVEIYNSKPELFHKSERNTQRRTELLEQIGMSNEQLEGWYIMLNRNPHKDRILEKYEWAELKNHADENLIQDSSPVESPSLPSSHEQSKRGRGRGRGGRKGRARGRGSKIINSLNKL